jgi:hypothetical protein
MADGTGSTVNFGGLVGNLKSFSGPNLSREMLDTTLLSTETAMIGVGSDLIDPGEVTMTTLWDPAVNPITEYFGDPKTLQVTWDGSGTWTITYDEDTDTGAFATSFRPTGITAGELMEAELTIKLSGLVVVA